MPESSYIPFFTNLPNTPLGISDLIDLAIMRKVHKRDNFKHLDEKQFRENAKQNLYNYRKKLAKPKEEREGLTTEDPDYWAVPPSEWGKHGGKKFAKWNGPTWEKVGPKSFRDQLNEKMKEKGETFDPFEQALVDTDGAQQDVGGAQSAQPIPVPLPFYARIVREGSFKFVAGFLACAFLVYCTAAVQYYNTYPEKGFVAALRFFHERVKEPDARGLLKRAYLEYGANKLDEAETTLVQVLENTDDSALIADTYNLLGSVESYKGFDKQAARSFKKAIEGYKQLGEEENLFLAQVNFFRVVPDAEISLPESLADENHPRVHRNHYFLFRALAEKTLSQELSEESLEWTQKAYDSAIKTNDITIISWATNSLAIAKTLNNLPAKKEMYEASRMAGEYQDSRLSLFNLACQFLVYQEPDAHRELLGISKRDKHFAKYMRLFGVIK